MKKKVTILVPCYNEEKCILILYSKLVSIISLHQQYNWEILYEVLKNVGDFRLLDRKYIDAIKQLRENERYTKFFAGQASTTSVINSMNFHYNHETIIKKKKNVTKK